MKNWQGILMFLVLIFALLSLANIASPYGIMQPIFFVLAGLAGLGIIFKLFGGSKWSDKAYAEHEKKMEDGNRLIAKLTAKQKKMEDDNRLVAKLRTKQKKNKKRKKRKK